MHATRATDAKTAVCPSSAEPSTSSGTFSERVRGSRDRVNEWPRRPQGARTSLFPPAAMHVAGRPGLIGEVSPICSAPRDRICRAR
jgi:hypothetical protein